MALRRSPAVTAVAGALRVRFNWGHRRVRRGREGGRGRPGRGRQPAGGTAASADRDRQDAGDDRLGEAPTGILKKSAISILAPTKTSTSDRPSCRKRNLSTMPASRKYSERRPRMAQTFDV